MKQNLRCYYIDSRREQSIPQKIARSWIDQRRFKPNFSKDYSSTWWQNQSEEVGHFIWRERVTGRLDGENVSKLKAYFPLIVLALVQNLLIITLTSNMTDNLKENKTDLLSLTNNKSHKDTLSDALIREECRSHI
ncbi:hypothetical protein OnM2_037040 [Erysiphe neolycopersici]|uniref:Uncharacterized protein n=1 Tax=Erysiphe neolycopersici TaxID=212602 RepID=A0A420HWY4_9PEZI|nr:hypothetical protein OnM2_037040 [Erysiphe neolycopersici]